MESSNPRTPTGLAQVAILILALATAAVHLYLSSVLFGMGQSGLLFLFNGLGYLALLAGLFLPIPILKEYRPVLRILFIIYTLVTIIAWVFVGARNAIGFIDKAIEVLLVVSLWLDRPRR
jgi:hypothetical protein